MLRVCVVGLGNVGREAVECIKKAPDMELAGVVRRNPVAEGLDCPVVSNVKELGKVDVAVLTVPTRQVENFATGYLEQGINTVDSFDIHGDKTMELRARLGETARKSGAVAVIGGGWDPGTNSVVRMLFQALAPKGLTYTNYGPGMSMGHTVAVKAIPGVAGALSMTLPAGFGKHIRDVYVKLEEGADFETVAKKIKEDPYFVNDVTHVTQVDAIEDVISMGHGVTIERFGSTGTAHNQVFRLILRVSNPSTTAQAMVSCARASARLAPGAYLMGEIPPIDLLAGDKETLLKKLT